MSKNKEGFTIPKGEAAEAPQASTAQHSSVGNHQVQSEDTHQGNHSAQPVQNVSQSSGQVNTAQSAGQNSGDAQFPAQSQTGGHVQSAGQASAVKANQAGAQAQVSAQTNAQSMQGATQTTSLDTQQKQPNKVTRTIGVIIGVVLCVISIPVIVVNCYIIIQGLVNPNEVPNIAGKSPLIVLTDSMFPTIQGGDLIVVEKCDKNDVKEGDIIAFFDPAATSGTTVVTHRVLEVTEQNGEVAWKCKGDANNAADKMLCPASKLVGMYNGQRYPNIGNICMWLKSVPGIICCVGIPILILVGYDIIRRRIYSKRQESTEDELRAELEKLKQQQHQQA